MSGKTKREQLEELTANMQSFADECDTKGETTPDDVLKLNQMATDVKALVESIKSEALAAGTLDIAKAFLGDLAGAPAPKTEPQVKDGIVVPNGRMTLGEAFTKSPVYADFVKASTVDGRVKEKGAVSMDAFTVPGFGAKNLVTGDSATSGGAFLTPARYQPVTDLIGDRELTVRDLCTNITIGSDSFEFVRVTSKTNNAAAVAEATSSADPTIDGDGVVTLNAGGGYKPESDMALAVVSTPVETIAHLMPITRRAAADAPQVRQLVDAFLLQGLREEEEDQILNGNGTSPNLRGILQTVGISTVGSAGTDIDAVVAGIAAIRLDRRRPNALVVHPSDWYSTGFLLAKDTAGNYIMGDPRASIEQLNTLWGLRVVVTEAMTENTLLIGDFAQCVVADREQSAIYVTDSHKDHFGRNILDILAEERLAVGVLDPDAFCTVTAV